MESATKGASLATTTTDHTAEQLTKGMLDTIFSPFDLKRLDSYASNMLDHHVIIDLVPLLATLYFTHRLPASVKLSGVQQSILLAIGLQRKGIEDVDKELNLPNQQVLAMFVKIMRKISTALSEVVSRSYEEELPGADEGRKRVGAEETTNGKPKFKALEQTLEEDLADGEDEIKSAMREKQREMINALELEKFEIPSAATEWDEAEKQISKSGSGGATVSVKTQKTHKRKAGETAAEVYEQEMAQNPYAKQKKNKKNKH